MTNEARKECKPCPFCGEVPDLYGWEVRDYVNGEWAEMTRKEYWVQTNCLPSCLMGNMQATAYGIVGGIRYVSEEAAIKAWNKRARR